MAYHVVDLPETAQQHAQMNAIKSLVFENHNAGYFGWIVTDNNPQANPYWSNTPSARWCKRLSASNAASGQALATAVATEIGAGRPRVMIDELSHTNAANRTKIKDCADILLHNPAVRRRWGVFVIRAGSVNVLQQMQPALDSVFRGSGNVAYEAYVQYSVYCNQGSNTGQRDIWLGNYFKDRCDYLLERRDAVSLPGLGKSFVSMVFGVTDKPSGPTLDLMNCNNAAFYLDRMFYVFRTRSGWSQLMHPTTGGAGSYKWDFDNLSTSVRDSHFRNSWNHYCRDQKNTYRWGPNNLPPCTGCT